MDLKVTDPKHIELITNYRKAAKKAGDELFAVKLDRFPGLGWEVYSVNAGPYEFTPLVICMSWHMTEDIINMRWTHNEEYWDYIEYCLNNNLGVIGEKPRKEHFATNGVNPFRDKAKYAKKHQKG